MNSLKQRITATVATLAIGLIASFEGTHEKPYLDPAGILTICTGHTGADVRANQIKSSDDCTAILKADVEKANDAINSCVRVPLTDNQRAAFISFTFNVGGGKFCRSTIAKKLNEKDYSGACAELSRWVNVNGRPLLGLVRRRAAERTMCEKKSA